MIYSPSQTKTYLTCSTARMLNQEGWTSRVVGIRDWTAWVGQGVHAGLASYFSHDWGKAYPEVVVPRGHAAFQAEYEHAIKSGRIIPNTFYVNEAKAHIERCLEYAMTVDILPAGFEVERTEQTLGDYNCILDVVGKKNGKPTFIDWKVKNKIYAPKREDFDFKVDQELEKYRYDWKEARHYPWALSQVTGQRVEEYSVVMFILQPFAVRMRTYEVNWKMVERWVQGCNDGGLWDTMCTAPSWQSNACMGGQWPCEYLDACWTYDLDREKMKHGGLIQVERLRNQTLASSQEE